MFAVVITEEGGAQRRLEFSKAEISIGRVQGNDIILAKRNVSKHHARIVVKGGAPMVVDLNSTNGTWVNGRKITAPLSIEDDDKIHIADFLIRVEPVELVDDAPARSDEPEPQDDGAGQRAASLDAPGAPTAKSEAVPEPEDDQPAGLDPSPSPPPEHAPTSTPDDGSQSLVDDGSPSLAGETTPPPPRESDDDQFQLHREPSSSGLSSAQGPPPDIEALGPLATLMARLAERFNIHDLDVSSMRDQGRWSSAQTAIAETLQSMQSDGALDSGIDTRQLAHAALHEAAGLGALDEVLSNQAVREVLVSGPDKVFVDTGSGLKPSGLRFSSRSALETTARRLAAETGQVLGQQPILHGVLSFGPHVTIAQQPLALNGPIIEIRMGAALSLADLTADGWFDETVQERLEQAVADSENVAVVGLMGAGVTVLLSGLAELFPANARIIAIEAVADLTLDRQRVVSLATSEANMPLSRVIRHANRLRGERLVIDDLTSVDLLEAVSAIAGRERGHLVGVHVGGDEPVESLLAALGASGASPDGAAALLTSAIDLVIQVAKSGGRHSVTRLVEIDGRDDAKVRVRNLL